MSRTKMYDMRFVENFKIFVGGPSRCGKTFFVVDLIQNLKRICKKPPTNIIYVYKVWQPKYDEIRDMVSVFIEDDDELIEKIKDYIYNQHSLIVFDDLINSKSVKNIAELFVVDGRHMNLSLVFLSQRLFVGIPITLQENCVGT